ncbi:MAG: hydrogen gas-evolving membrane-bound hydrogenase subunit E [Verrucomicrobiota bacterium]
MLLPAILLILFTASIAAVFSLQIPSRFRPLALSIPAAASFLLLFAITMPAVLAQGFVEYRAEWIPQLGLDFALRLNGLGLLLALLVTGIGALIMLYAGGYMEGYPLAQRLYSYLYAFMLAMTGLAMSDHLIVFFVFWELTSITSYLLIGFNHDKPESRRNALQALLVTGLGGMALLAGLILLANAAGTWYFSELVAQREVILAHPHYIGILVLIIIGAFTKSAQFPFHFWLPNAMAAPTPVSAYLHSATMVKAGVFLLAIMLPVIGGTPGWTYTLCLSGGITLLLGGLFGLRQDDLKKILAGTTLAVLGLLTLLLGVGTEKAVLAALLFLLGHAFYKAALFMVAGSIDHETGTRDSRILGGLRTAMPWTAAAAGLAALSKMGLPPLFGFLGKEYTYKASLASEAAILITATLVLGNAILLALAAKAGILPFWKKPSEQPLPKHPHEAPWSMRTGPILLAVLGLGIGMFPHLVEPLLSSAKTIMVGKPSEVEVKLWAGFNLPLALSVVTVVSGICILFFNRKIGDFLKASPIPSMESAYDGLLNGTIKLATIQTRFLQSGYLRNYLLIIIIATCALVISKLWRFGGFALFNQGETFSITSIVVSLIMLGGIVVAVFTRSRLSALIALGVVGFGVALIFSIYSAPDLAITQILVETLTVVLFAWVVYKLPAFKKFSSKRTMLIDAGVSGVVGVLVTILILKSEALSLGPTISKQLADWSYPEAHGANVVNVILVDFRALDTFGEIAVLSIAAIGVWALIQAGAKSVKKGSD